MDLKISKRGVALGVSQICLVVGLIALGSENHSFGSYEIPVFLSVALVLAGVGGLVLFSSLTRGGTD